MSVSSEVQRTLVKSPPELWAELSDPASLARHLGELGEVRIVRTEPERAVDWEAAAGDGAQASGRVEIAPSGWGTRVTLSASRIVAPESSEPEPEATEVIPEPEAKSIAEPEPALETTEPEPEALEPEPSAEPSEPMPGPETAERESRRGFFARLFRRRHREQTPPEPEAMVEPEPESELSAVIEIEEPPPEDAVSDVKVASELEEAPEVEALAEVVAASEVNTVDEADIAAELAGLEQQTTAVLTGVLDRLGAAHHRPFSRS